MVHGAMARPPGGFPPSLRIPEPFPDQPAGTSNVTREWPPSTRTPVAWSVVTYLHRLMSMWNRPALIGPLGTAGDSALGVSALSVHGAGLPSALGVAAAGARPG